MLGLFYFQYFRVTVPIRHTHKVKFNEPSQMVTVVAQPDAEVIHMSMVVQFSTGFLRAISHLRAQNRPFIQIGLR